MHGATIKIIKVTSFMNISCARQRNFNYNIKECNDKEPGGRGGGLGDQWHGVPFSVGGNKYFLPQKCPYQLWDPTKFISNG
jgi:hypothetical protein